VLAVDPDGDCFDLIQKDNPNALGLKAHAPYSVPPWRRHPKSMC
jgi:hypothetical protein